MTTISNLNNPDKERIRVLVAPLDWGLGHATRCIPIIRQLIALNCEVLIASSGAQKSLLEKEFPALRSLELPGYGVKYGKMRWSTHLKIFIQIPKILTAIKRENRWLKAFLARERLDLLISDNRYGLYSEGLFSVFMTHQLCIQTPFGAGPLGKIPERRLRRVHYRFINHFSRCWVPDLETGKTLAGRLSHPEIFPAISTRYIGILSRFTKEGEFHSEGSGEGGRREAVSTGAVSSAGMAAVVPGIMDIDILFLLSGPEPQRTLLEKKIARELRSYSGRAVIVRGLPGKKQAGTEETIERGIDPMSGIAAGSFETADVSVYSHLTAAALKKIIDRSALIISRAGYSTIMDLAALGKRAVLIPTPGQSEQEYLGDRLDGMGLFLCAYQRKFSLPAVLRAAGQFSFGGFEGYTGGGKEGLLYREIRELLDKIDEIRKEQARENS